MRPVKAFRVLFSVYLLTVPTLNALAQDPPGKEENAEVTITSILKESIPLNLWGVYLDQQKPVVDYLLDVTLDTEKKTLRGTERLQYTNHSQDTIEDLQFHMYLNAFRNEKSTFMQESGGQLRNDLIPEDGFGYIHIERASVNGEDFTGQTEFIQPDSSHPGDRTVMRILLNRPLLPGETATIEFDFQAKLPKVFARTGFRDDFFLVGQWYPKIGVWETAGARQRKEPGWNCHQFHANSEFYADYGNYKTRITVPKSFVVGATGLETEKVEGPDLATYTFEQDHIHDFAFTASPNYLRIERDFVPEDQVTQQEYEEMSRHLGLPVEEIALKKVTMILLIQKEHEDQVERHFKAMVASLKYFGLWYGAYPYSTLTCVDPAYGARGAGGMEYPTLITAGTSWRQPEDLGAPAGVIVHEFGHQYWYGMVGSNEFEESWLDEGLNTFSTGLIMDKVYGPQPFYVRFLGFPVRMNELLGINKILDAEIARIGGIVDGGKDALVRKAWEFKSDTSYAVNSYPKSALVLHQLSREIGLETFDRGMRNYFQKWRFGHPSTRDFQRAMEEASNRDLNEFFEHFVFGPGHVDYAVGDVKNERLGNEKGYMDSESGTILVTEDDLKDRPEIEDSEKKYRVSVEILNEGNTPYPVPIQMTFADGSVIMETWDGSYPWVRFVYESKPKLTRVEIDPEHQLVLDLNFANNSYSEETGPKASLRWSAQLLLWLQHGLHLLAGGL